MTDENRDFNQKIEDRLKKAFREFENTNLLERFLKENPNHSSQVALLMSVRILALNAPDAARKAMIIGIEAMKNPDFPISNAIAEELYGIWKEEDDRGAGTP